MTTRSEAMWGLITAHGTMQRATSGLIGLDVVRDKVMCLHYTKLFDQASRDAAGYIRILLELDSRENKN